MNVNYIRHMMVCDTRFQGKKKNEKNMYEPLMAELRLCLRFAVDFTRFLLTGDVLPNKSSNIHSLVETTG